MKEKTKQEILDKAAEIWRDSRLHPPNFRVEVKPNQVEITVERMYEFPPLNLKILKELAEFFGTENINDDDHYSSAGCETCDYGSIYSFTLTIRPD